LVPQMHKYRASGEERGERPAPVRAIINVIVASCAPHRAESLKQ
jgi:hypothetical protein